MATPASRIIPTPPMRTMSGSPPLPRPLAARILDLRQPPLAVGRVRHVGEAVAVVVAETLTQARDAAEVVAVEYRILPAVTDAIEALADGAPALWPAAPGNLALDNAFGDQAAVETALASAHLVVEQTIRSQRTLSAFMEPRAAVGSYDAAEQKYKLVSGCQGAHRLRSDLAACLKVPPERVQRGLSGCRRRLRVTLQSVCRAARSGVGEPARRSAGQMDRRAQRVFPHRLYRARRRHPCAASASIAAVVSWRWLSS